MLFMNMPFGKQYCLLSTAICFGIMKLLSNNPWIPRLDVWSPLIDFIFTWTVLQDILCYIFDTATRILTTVLALLNDDKMLIHAHVFYIDIISRNHIVKKNNYIRTITHIQICVMGHGFEYEQLIAATLNGLKISQTETKP